MGDDALSVEGIFYSLDDAPMIDRHGFALEDVSAATHEARETERSNQNELRRRRHDDVMAETGASQRPIDRKDRRLIDLARGGLPSESRPRWWLKYSRARDRLKRNGGYYTMLLKRNSGMPSRAAREIELDLMRTFPTNVHFCNSAAPKIAKLRRLLVAYSWHNPRIGYCQGMSQIAAFLLLVVPEEEAFWLFVVVLEEYLPSDWYTPGLTGSHVDQLMLQRLIEKQLPRLHARIRHFAFDLPLISLHWFLTLYISVCTTETALRIWDVFVTEGRPALFRITLNMLQRHEDELLRLSSMESLYEGLKSLPGSIDDLGCDYLFQETDWELGRERDKPRRRSLAELLLPNILFRRFSGAGLPQPKLASVPDNGDEDASSSSLQVIDPAAVTDVHGEEGRDADEVHSDVNLGTSADTTRSGSLASISAVPDRKSPSSGTEAFAVAYTRALLREAKSTPDLVALADEVEPQVLRHVMSSPCLEAVIDSVGDLVRGPAGPGAQGYRRGSHDARGVGSPLSHSRLASASSSSASALGDDRAKSPLFRRSMSGDALSTLSSTARADRRAALAVERPISCPIDAFEGLTRALGDGDSCGVDSCDGDGQGVRGTAGDGVAVRGAGDPSAPAVSDSGVVAASEGWDDEERVRRMSLGSFAQFRQGLAVQKKRLSLYADERVRRLKQSAPPGEPAE